MNAMIFDPAGADVALRRAASSAGTDRSAGIAEVLLDSRGDAGLRGHRSAVLAAACVDSDVADVWLKEEPSNPDALLLYARKMVVLALRERMRPKAELVAIVEMATRACEAAADADPEDPTPLVALLTLRQLDPARLQASRSGSFFDLDHGPWDLLEQIDDLDPLNREAYHRFLQCLLPRNGGSVDAMFGFVEHVRSSLPPDTDPQTIALVAHVEHHKERIGRDHNALAVAERQLRTPQVAQMLMQLFDDGWFKAAAARRFPPISDLSHLAYVLYHAGFVSEAHAVFEAMGRYGSVMPWSIHGDAQQHFQHARAHCASVFADLSARRADIASHMHDARIHDAGADLELARAVSSIMMTRPTGISEVMRGSRGRWDLRASRSRMLASACADSDLADWWVKEDRSNPDAWLLYARVAGIRAQRAVRHGRTDAPDFIRSAVRACQDATTMDRGDPTPLVELISLARLAPYVSSLPPELVPVPGFGAPFAMDPFRREPGPGQLAKVHGPWRLLHAVLGIAPLHREGHLQFMRSLSPVHGGSLEQMWMFAYAVGEGTPVESDPQLLALYSCDEEYRVLRESGGAATGTWAQEARTRLLVDLVDEGWLKAARGRAILPVKDLSYLAYGLFMAGRYGEAREVFAALGPYAHAAPWVRHGAPAEAIAWAKAKCESGRGLPAWHQFTST